MISAAAVFVFLWSLLLFPMHARAYESLTMDEYDIELLDHNSDHSSNDDLVISGYVGFNDMPEMLYPASDFTGTLFNAAETPPGKPGAIYLVGGCIARQGCRTNETTGSRFCQCGLDSSNEATYYGGGPEVYSKKCTFFEPSTETWGTCADSPRVRYRHSAVNFKGKLYLIGGRTFNESIIIPEVDCYNPRDNTWTTVTTQPSQYLTSDNAAFVTGDSIHIVGGYLVDYTPVATVLTYNVVSNTWSASAIPSMGTPRGDIGLAQVNDLFIVLGGFNTYPGAALNVVEAYNSTTNEWTTLSPMLFGRGDMAHGVIGSRVFAVGGETITDFVSGASVPVRAVGRLNTAAASAGWTTETNITRDLFRFVGVSYSGEIKDSSSTAAIYLFGGQSLYDETTQTHHLSNSTILYVPVSVAREGASHKKKLSDGEIAGVVIGVAVGVAIGGTIILSLLGYCVYNRYQKLQDSTRVAETT